MAGMTPGIHDPVEVTATALAVNKNTGNEQITVAFRNAEGATITAYLPCTAKAWPYTEQKLRTLGWDPVARGFAVEELNADPSPIAGVRAQIVINEEWFGDKAVAKVAFINPCGGGLRERMSAQDAAAFGARLRARLRGQPDPVRARKSDDPGPPPDEDHIPF